MEFNVGGNLAAVPLRDGTPNVECCWKGNWTETETPQKSA